MCEEGIAARELSPQDLPAARRKRTTAQSRWRILAKALIRSQQSIGPDPREDVSVRRFTSFDLLRIRRAENAPSDPDQAVWYEYSAQLDGKLFAVQIRRAKRNFTASELIGFNNTGNICVWPSEECLAYYLLRNGQLCRGRRVLELGGGMSCLAGMLAAKYCDPREVTLTDGNATSVSNARRIVARNGLGDRVECAVVQWARAARAMRSVRSVGPFLESWSNGGKDTAGYTGRSYDVILCADCLFFDEARSDLVETIYGWLANDGVALVMAPRRGKTFEKFAEAAMKRGFVARQIDRYDGKIWSRHLELLDRCQEYCPDLHYPILLELTKQRKTAPG